MLSKEECRQEAKRIRAGAHELHGYKAAEAATVHALKLFSDMDKTTIFALYEPIGTEIDVRFLGSTLVRAGFRTALPVVTAADQPLSFKLWAMGDPLEGGPMGTKHPPTDAPDVMPDVLIVPLLAFDRDCHRIGWGAGFYDRTLAMHHSGMKVFGFAYGAQYTDRLPVEEHDWPLHGVITEEGLILPRT